MQQLRRQPQAAAPPCCGRSSSSRRAALPIGRQQQRCSATISTQHPHQQSRLQQHQQQHHQQQRLLAAPLQELMAEAAALRDQRADGRIVTFSPKVFIPLTRLCADQCGYCTFALAGPAPGRRCYMTLEEVLGVARMGAAQGCTEALFTLGDKPEARFPEAAAELAAMGHSTTLDYVAAAAAAVLAETGLVPHINAGVMGEPDLRRLKAVSGSQGLMLEGTSDALTAPGGAHAVDCPDKAPAVRLAALEAAGRARVPFTTGLLIGLGESRAARLADLALIRDLQDRHGHIQEVIIQNFRAKPNTRMAAAPEPSLDELLWTVAAARIVLGPDANIQAPPNLTPALDSSSSPQAWRALLDAGINDWGGISPLTKDYVNPEKAWPHLGPLAAATAAAGKLLLPRLPVYPAFIQDLGSSSSSKEPWLSQQGGAGSVAAAVHRLSDGSGLVRGHSWVAGAPVADAAEQEQQQQELPPALQQLQSSLQQLHDAVGAGSSAQDQPAAAEPAAAAVPLPRPRASKLWSIQLSRLGVLQGMPEPQQVSPGVQQLLDRVLQAAGLSAPAHQQQPATTSTSSPPACSSSSSSAAAAAAAAPALQWTEAEVATLLSARGVDMAAVVAAADALRAAVCGDTVSFVVNRNINYTNICTYGCRFCAFSKGKASDESLRGPAYLLSLDEVTRRTAEAWDRGATEVCLQGGIHPDFTGQTYLDILQAAKAGAPDIHVHAFSPLEVSHGAASLGLPLADFLARLRDAGLGSLPGTAAEVLDDDVRAVLCPDKLSASEWLHVIETAHAVGLPTTSTIMFGHVDSLVAQARHLLALRGLQARTGGITEFVPLPFVHMQAPMYLAGGARRGPTLRECVLMHAVSRLVLWPLITNIQASWVKMGPQEAAHLLAAGANDMGGSLINESITRAAGASYGQELPPQQMRALIVEAGRTPRQRTTTYGAADASGVAGAAGAAGALAASVAR